VLHPSEPGHTANNLTVLCEEELHCQVMLILAPQFTVIEDTPPRFVIP